MYFLNYIDRNAIAQARLNDLEEDLNMYVCSLALSTHTASDQSDCPRTGTQFNTTVSILFVGYVLMQIPSNMLITRIRPSLYMSSWMLVWATVSACTALVKSYSGLVMCRFLLGVTEAPVRLTFLVHFNKNRGSNADEMSSSILVLRIC